jgi:hypothetical protein
MTVGRPVNVGVAFAARREERRNALRCSALRLLGAPEWMALLERRLERPLAPRKPGPKPRVEPAIARQARLL